MNEEMEHKLVARLNSALAEASFWKSEAEDFERWNQKYRERISSLRNTLREISMLAPTDNMDLVPNMAREALKSDQTIASKVSH